MSKKDSQFFNIFSAILGILFVVTLLLFAFARSVGDDNQVQHVLAEPRRVADVTENIKPLVRVAVAGKDNAALAIVESNPDAPVFALPVPKDGAALYEAVCKTCHTAGIGGAPKAGDRTACTPRMAQGKATLYDHAVKGYNGKAGVMPAKGGRIDLTDDLIKLGVDHLLGMSK